MEVAIVTRLSAKRNMDIYACHSSKHNYKFLLAAFLLIGLFLPVHAQLYSINIPEPKNNVVKDWIRSQPPAQDSVSWVLAGQQLLQSLHFDGYLLAEFSRWEFQNDTLYVVVNPGNIIHWAKLHFRGREFLPPHWVDQLDVSGDIVQFESWRQNIMDVLKEAQQEGFLFADYSLHIISIHHDSIAAEIHFNPGRRMIFDSVEIEGSARLAKDFLERSLGLRPGEPLSPDHLLALQHQLNNLRFVTQVAPPVLILFGDKARIRVYLNNRSASVFDILAGFHPSPDPDKSLTLTGYVELDLVNQLTRGERIYLHLEKLRPRSQQLEVSLSYPYLLDLPFGVEGTFELLKNDTFYSDLSWHAGIFMPLGKDQFLRAAVTQQSTNIISLDQSRIIATKRLPPYLDLRINGITLALVRSRLDYDLNPRKGYRINITGNLSQKKIRPSSLIENINQIDPGFDYTSLYDTLQQPVSRFSLQSSIQYFIPWGSRSTIMLAADAGAIKSGGQVYTNELFRLGGYAILRGFDEESILAQYYAVLTAEYRLIIGGSSYVSLFGDYAWVQNEEVEVPFTDHPFGVGIGLTLETEAGIFGLRAAVGSQQGNPLDFNATRIHLGYVNRF